MIVCAFNTYENIMGYRIPFTSQMDKRLGNLLKIKETTPEERGEISALQFIEFWNSQDDIALSVQEKLKDTDLDKSAFNRYSKTYKEATLLAEDNYKAAEEINAGNNFF